jgi:glycosyltransferase involved in cell wall biosynthesis
VQEPFVIVGRQAWSCDEEMAMIRRAPGIVYFDWLGRDEVVTLLRAARALVFASLYEGFGLPVLEAFACGTAAIAGRGSGLGEVAGEAALTVDPYDTAAIRDAFRALSGPEGEGLRADLAARGLARARDFDETAIAARLAAFYHGVMAG